MIDNYTRYQTGLSLDYLYPNHKDNTCACGCGKKLEGKKRKWHSKECRIESLTKFYILKGDTSVIRNKLFELDHGFCRSCGVYDENWQADHIIPVSLGGGGCSIENYQTLCLECHKEKTSKLNRIPNSTNIFASCIDIFPPSLNTCRAF